ncbi:putative amidoligase domain-containing protein [Paenibacillus brevis]|uniref:Phage phiEco32-like COOH-NH2 ligase-type 2 n=1 Tax=Paenibacillus brevis TaxID=2841508 RepID=A0ABS6FSS7_9BACL|nr:hypothetical protein [Paenibacillus brevis]MBU5672463.1 hypothetical protein [Paenibacillus brevis]
MSVRHVLVLPSLNAEMKRKLILALNRNEGPFRVLNLADDRLQVFREGRLGTKDRWNNGRVRLQDNCLCYGPADADAGGDLCEWPMNFGAGLVRNRSVKQMESRLRMEGISSELSRGPAIKGYYRRYLVQVYHLQPLQMVPWNGEDALSGMALPQSAAAPVPGSPLWKRLSRTAVHSLYALGLDYGEVMLRTDGDGQSIVEHVADGTDWRSPGWEWRMADAMRQQLQLLSQWQSELPVPLIGMDPEFLLYNPDTRKVIPASRYLDRQGVAGCDVLRYRGRRMLPLAELRPKPGSEPREVVLHLLAAFRTARAAISDDQLIWQAGGMPQQGFPLGGHLHFSGVPLSGELLRVLDNYLALPVALLEDERSARRRPRYGSLGDYRLQDYGGFEYRTLPSFLISPMVTKGIVALARAITESYRELDQRPLELNEVRKAFYRGTKTVLAREWPPLARRLRELPAYERYQSYIDPLLDAISSGATWDESADIRLMWRL